MAAKLTLDDLEYDEESVQAARIPKKGKPEPRAADLYFMVLRACHMGMINPILRQFDVVPNKPLQDEDFDKFMAALKYAKDLFERPSLGNAYLIKLNKDNELKEKEGEKEEIEAREVKILTEEEVISISGCHLGVSNFLENQKIDYKNCSSLLRIFANLVQGIPKQSKVYSGGVR